MSAKAVPAVETAAAVARLREEFPILAIEAHGRRLAYLDNAATTQKPREVLDAMAAYYTSQNANVHRGVHLLSERATAAFEGAREHVAAFFGAARTHEIVFTRNATESINLVAASWGGANLRPGDEVLISAMEHHSNIVPWQLACEKTGAVLRVIPIDERGVLDMDAFARLLSTRTKIVAVSHLSNALGTINPVADIARAAHAAGAVVLVDGAQAAYHLPVDVQALGADFYVATGHKLYGPTGMGVLYGREALLDRMPPYQGGGDMIASVTFEKSTWNALPYKFEAGTPHIEGAVALGVAVRFIRRVGFDWIAAHERELLAYATAAVSDIPGVRLIGTSPEKASILSFVMGDIHPHDIATARASFAMYNTREDVDQLVAALHDVRRMFA
jgi:cysteine desulfurase/selenocysteine lyase